MPTPRHTQPLLPIGRGLANAILTTAGMCLAASTYLLGRGAPGGTTELLGIGGIAVALVAAFTATLTLGTMPFDAKDHLRPGEQRTLTIRSAIAAATAAVLLMWPAIAWQATFPLPVAAAHCLTVGLLIRWAALAYVRLLRDANGRDCGGSYDNCLSCDTAYAVLDLCAFLDSVDATAKDDWLIDPLTGKRLYLDSHRYEFTEDIVDDTGHHRQRIYMLTRLPGYSFARLTGVTVYHDGPIPQATFTSMAEYDALSIDRAGIEALHAQLVRTVDAGATVG